MLPKMHQRGQGQVLSYSAVHSHLYSLWTKGRGTQASWDGARRVRRQADHGPVGPCRVPCRLATGKELENMESKREERALKIVSPTMWDGCLVTSYKLTGI